MNCCFIGHRKIELSEDLCKRIEITIKNLIMKGYDTFYFGSRSEFNDLCHKIVTELKQKEFPKIVRKSFVCEHETCILESQRKKIEEIYGIIKKRPVVLYGVEEKIKLNGLFTGKGCYVERNKKMIDASDICVFYYNQDYLPPKRRNSKKQLCDYQSKSGTQIAYNYALSKKKKIINLNI